MRKTIFYEFVLGASFNLFTWALVEEDAWVDNFSEWREECLEGLFCLIPGHPLLESLHVQVGGSDVRSGGTGVRDLVQVSKENSRTWKNMFTKHKSSADILLNIQGNFRESYHQSHKRQCQTIANSEVWRWKFEIFVSSQKRIFRGNSTVIFRKLEQNFC